MPKLRWTEEQTKDIIDKYVNYNMGLAQIAKIYDSVHGTIRQVLIRNNIPRRRQIRDFINENYFDKIDTETKAYLLGFITADGCIYNPINQNKKKIKWQKHLCIMLQNRDIGILELIKKELNSSKKIIYISTRSNSCKFSITSDRICDKLISYGCGERKTFTARFPQPGIIPNNLIKHYVRGLFDGDGCICSTQQDKKQNPCFSFDICGTQEICNAVQQELSNIVVLEDKKKMPLQQGKIYRMYYRKLQSLKNIYNYLYNDATIFLDRKRNKFKEIFDIITTKKMAWDIR